MSKQIMPNKVSLHIPGINQNFLRFVDYLKKTRDGSGRVADITEVMPLLYTDGMQLHDCVCMVLYCSRNKIGVYNNSLETLGYPPQKQSPPTKRNPNFRA